MKAYNIISLLTIILSLGSCEKYLDIKTESQQVFVETLEDCQKLLDGYSVMNTNYPSDGEASAGDYYMTDASYLASARTPEDRAIYTWQPGAIRDLSTPQYKTGYFKIYTANLVLETLEELKDNPDQAKISELRGSALFYRSFCHWQLAQMYSKPYTTASAGQDPGIPLRLESDVNERLERGTVKQTYDRIIQDLQEAIPLLPASTIVSSRPSKAAALGMLARVYLSMGEYPQALINANAALQIKSDLISFSTLNVTSATPFARFNTEVLFHAVMTNNSLLVGGITASNVAKIQPDLVASYAANDLRRTIFFKPVAGTPGSFTFTGNYEPTTAATLFCGLAVDELYLTRAECHARAGNAALAMADLNTLLRTRWSGPYTDMTAASADDALDKILKERRKELLLRGLRWSDLRRLNMDSRFAVTLTRTVEGQQYVLPAGDLRYTLLLPREVITNAGYAQNPR
jgi:tetratricopeptide (TPR) repeat protein